MVQIKTMGQISTSTTTIILLMTFTRNIYPLLCLERLQITEFYNLFFLKLLSNKVSFKKKKNIKKNQIHNHFLSTKLETQIMQQYLKF